MNLKAEAVFYRIIKAESVGSLIKRSKLEDFRHTFWLSDCAGHCPTLLVKISTFVGQNVGQTVGYGIGIAVEFVRQLSKSGSNQYRSCTTGKNGPGGI